MSILRYIIKATCISGALLFGKPALSSGASISAPRAYELDLKIQNNCSEGFFLDESSSGFYRDLNENLPRFISPSSTNKSFVSTRLDDLHFSPTSSYGAVIYRLESDPSSWFELKFIDPKQTGDSRISLDSSDDIVVSHDDYLPSIILDYDPINTQIDCKLK